MTQKKRLPTLREPLFLLIVIFVWLLTFLVNGRMKDE